jgi:hypothetical protein
MASDGTPANLRSGNGRRKEKVMRKVFSYGGIAASVILVAFGAGAIVIGTT